jgi:hypothetical protein
MRGKSARRLVRYLAILAMAAALWALTVFSTEHHRQLGNN